MELKPVAITFPKGIAVYLQEIDELLGTIRHLNENVASLEAKIDALTLAVTHRAPVQLDLPLDTKPVAEEPGIDAPKTKPVKVKRLSKRASHILDAMVAATVTEVSGADEVQEDEVQEDEDALRACVEFEGKRVQRLLGIGGLRGAIRKATGEPILVVDDVPARLLPQLLSDLQAM